MKLLKFCVPLLALTVFCAQAEPIGEVDTAFKLLGPNHKIIVEAYDDPKVKGVTCHVSRAKSGGFTGMIGLAEDRSEASIACRQVNEISSNAPRDPGVQAGEERSAADRLHCCMKTQV